MLGRFAGTLNQLAIDKLELEPGEAVLDIGCGTWALTPALAEAVGPQERVVARTRTTARAWWTSRGSGPPGGRTSRCGWPRTPGRRGTCERPTAGSRASRRDHDRGHGQEAHGQGHGFGLHTLPSCGMTAP
ncbi:hypothetical protein [Lentzea nigeriaca]|uniref:hypothetical protein n=1 Tax=Lentzea nigeriaca TaxID=1128665 RepID=UPI0035580427